LIALDPFQRSFLRRGGFTRSGCGGEDEEHDARWLIAVDVDQTDEAYIVDIPGPWKRLLPDYQKLEADLERKLQAFFGLPPKSVGCKAADLIALMVEGRALLTSRGETMIEGGIPFGYAMDADQWIAAHGKSVFGLSPAGARTSFMHRYEKLTRKRK